MVKRALAREGLHRDISKIVYSSEAEDALRWCKKKDRALFVRAENQILKILREPNIDKPLRYSLRNRRRVQIGSFVLVYELFQGELRFINFDHHDKIYKKYKS